MKDPFATLAGQLDFWHARDAMANILRRAPASAIISPTLPEDSHHAHRFHC